MNEHDSVMYRKLDHNFRVLEKVQGAQSPINATAFGDSPNLPNIYFVDSGNGADGNDGRDPAKPLATIDAAVNKCSASLGDVILVQPGHAETLTALIAMDTIGVSIIGVGNGTLRPQLTINAVIDGISVTAANCRIENIGFAASTAGATSQINVAAADCVLAGVHFAEGASDLLGTITITAAGEVCTIEDCTVIVSADGPDEWVLVEGVVDRLTIRNNHVVGSDGTNAVDLGIINCAAVAVTNLKVYGNDFSGGGVATIAVVGTGLVAPMIQDNKYSGLCVQGVFTGANFIPGLGYEVVKTDGDPTAASGSPDALFTVTGRCLVTLLYGEVTTIISGGTAPEVALQTTTDNVVIAASTVITTDAAGTLYMVSGDFGVILNGADAPSVVVAQVASAGHQPFLINGDGIEQLNGGGAVATGGVIEWTLFYIPLETDARIVAAA